MAFDALHVLDAGVWEALLDLVMAAFDRHPAGVQMQPLLDRAMKRMQEVKLLGGRRGYGKGGGGLR
jgi:hypothetical protein